MRLEQCSDVPGQEILDLTDGIISVCSKMLASSRPTSPVAPQNDEAAAVLSESIKSESTSPLPYQERITASGPEKVFTITPEYVRQMVATIVKDQGLSRYIL